MKVAIYNDKGYFINQIPKYLRIYEKKYQEIFCIYKFASSEEIYDLLNRVADMNLVFVDPSLKDMDNIQVAKKIREFNHKVKIIFFSYEDKWAVQGYEVDAEYYWLRTLEYLSFEKNMNTVLHKIKINANKFYSDITDKGRISIYFENIIYIETNARKTRIHTYSEDYVSHRTMKNHEQLLDDKNFFRCHAAYIVNLQYIKSVKVLTILLRDGTKVPISKMRKASFIKAFEEFI